MPRALSLKARRKIEKELKRHPTNLGAKLGETLARLNIPASAVATYMEVSTDTIYRWAYNEVPQSRITEVKHLLRNIDRCIKSGLHGRVSVRNDEFHSLMSRSGR